MTRMRRVLNSLTALFSLTAIVCHLRIDTHSLQAQDFGNFLNRAGKAIEDRQYNQRNNQNKQQNDQNNQQNHQNNQRNNRAPNEFDILEKLGGAIRNDPNYNNNSDAKIFGAVIEGLQHLETQEDRFGREEDRLNRLWEQGKISEERYNELLNASANRLGSEDSQFGNYQPGWQERQSEWQRFQQNPDYNVEQKKLTLEYVKYGDRPLEVDKGVLPKPNPVLGNPVAYETSTGITLARTINDGLKADVIGLSRSLPEDCRVEGTLKVVEELKAAGGQQTLLDNLQAAVVDRDTRRFERNAQALQLPQRQIQRMLLGLMFENLQDKIEDKASSEELAKVCEPMVSRLDEAGLDEDFRTSLIDWLQGVPQLVRIRNDLTAGGTVVAPNWPSGDVPVVYDPRLVSGEARILPGGFLAAGGDGESQVSMWTGNKYTASGLPLLEGAASTSDSKRASYSKPDVPSLLLEYPDEGGVPLRYSIICYQDVPTSTPGATPSSETWRQEYTIEAGLSQPLALSWNGKKWYQITCHSTGGTGKSNVYSLKAPAGYSPTYAFDITGNSVSLVKKSDSLTLDNRSNARPFLYMLGNEYHTIRAGGTTTFDMGVTLRYARNGKTTVPNDANGQPIPKATEVSTDISTVTLRGNETGVIGVNGDGDWEIRSGGEVQVAQRNFMKRPVASASSTEQPSTVVPATAGPAVVDPRGTLYVVSIGVSKYKNSSDLPTLMFADKDAKVLSELLVQQKKVIFEDVEAITLSNEEATAFKVRIAMKGLNRKVTKNDTVAIIFSGHGIVDKSGMYYLCPYDYESANTLKGISCKELRETTSELSAKNVFVFLDSCYSGGATKQLQKDFDEQISRVGNSGVVIFASSKASESSQEDASWGNGAFTKSFLDTVANPENDLNKDSLVQVSELDIGLAAGIKRLTSGGQHAQSTDLGNSIKNLPLARYKTN